MTLLCVLIGTSAYAVEITLAWDPNTEPDLDGYTVYYAVGSPGPPYDYVGDLPLDQVADPDNPQITLTDLNKHVNYYFALTAYDINGNESSFSSSLCIYIDDIIQECAPASEISGAVGGGGGGSSNDWSCFISSSRHDANAGFGSGGSMMKWLSITIFVSLLFIAIMKSKMANSFCKIFIQRNSVHLISKWPFKDD